jgi:hypothetical protein
MKKKIKGETMHIQGQDTWLLDESA